MTFALQSIAMTLLSLSTETLRSTTRRTRMLASLAACLCLIGPAFAQPAAPESRAAAAQGYALGPQDRVRITIVEWVAGNGEIRSPINGEYTIGPTGRLSLPLLGDVPAASLEPGALAAEVSTRLQAKLGLSEAPVTSIEIVQFRPIFVMGDVERPGEFPFRPGLSVLRATALAGGYVRPTAGAMAQAEREAEQAGIEERAVRARLVAVKAKQARAAAELADSDRIVFPQELLDRKSETSVADLMRLEEALFDARRATFASNASAQANLLDLFAKEIVSLQGQTASLKRHEETTQRQGDNLRSLQARGLATLGREFDIDRLLAEVEIRKQDVESRIIRLEQERVRTGDSMQKAKAQRRQEAATEMQALRSEEGELMQRLSSLQRIQAEAAQTAGQGQARFSVFRQSAAGEETETPVSFTTPLQPGDVLLVRVGKAKTSSAAELAAPGRASLARSGDAPSPIASREANVQ